MVNSIRICLQVATANDGGTGAVMLFISPSNQMDIAICVTGQLPIKSGKMIEETA